MKESRGHPPPDEDAPVEPIRPQRAPASTARIHLAGGSRSHAGFPLHRVTRSSLCLHRPLALVGPATREVPAIDPARGLWRAQRCSDSVAEMAAASLRLLAELWAYMKARKRWWLLPIVVIMVVLGGLIVLAEGSALAPFIYAIF